MAPHNGLILVCCLPVPSCPECVCIEKHCEKCFEMWAKTLEVLFSWPLLFELIQSPCTNSPKRRLSFHRQLFCLDVRVAPVNKQCPQLRRTGIKGEAEESTDQMRTWVRKSQRSLPAASVFVSPAGVTANGSLFIILKSISVKAELLSLSIDFLVRLKVAV